MGRFGSAVLDVWKGANEDVGLENHLTPLDGSELTPGLVEY